MKEDYSSGFLKYFYCFWRSINFPRQHRRMFCDALSALEVQTSFKVLELACGPGNNIKFLAEKIGPSGFILCTDVSTEMLKLAKNQAQAFPDKNIQLKQLDASQIQFDKEFDVVICMLGFSVIPDYEKAITGACRALKPNGKIAVIDAQRYKKFPFYLLNFLVRVVHHLFKAKERDLRSTLNGSFNEIFYKEYMGSSYFLYVGQKHE